MTARDTGPLYDCGNPECDPCERAFGSIRARLAVATERLEQERWELCAQWPDGAVARGRARERLSKIEADIWVLRARALERG